MKHTLFFTVVTAVFFLLPQEASPQKVKVNVKEKVVEETDNRANRKTDEVIDAGFDKIEEGIGNIFKKKEKMTKDDSSEQEAGSDESGYAGNASGLSRTEAKEAGQPQLTLRWNKYDFIPGEKIIFEDNQEGEENGEFPSRWDLAGGGNVENASFGDQNVIYFREAESCIVPFFKEPARDNLPELFTIEFDCWFEPDEYCQYFVDFWDHKNQSETTIDIDPLIINANHAGINEVGEGFYPGFEEKGEIITGFWRHVAISFNTRALKVYLDDARVVNIPNLGINPEGITICCDRMNSAGAEGVNRFIKNIRIAEGAVRLYDKLMQDGKIVASGIRFDVNKATIKPESMGVINAIYALLKDHPEIKLGVEGHTDSDGDNAFNQDLSERRARAVADQLVQMGIDSSRLTSKGWGESKPAGPNDSSEGKAANRRVEFVRL
ncbi:MAG: OmpA family protein [Bacteroidota bacterium]|jgi:outer membrane protein OmpA-like peptidoglycan-associated protein|nr:OmpA family protein [Bacteroidota bacterium]